jgi:hypothetical protein
VFAVIFTALKILQRVSYSAEEEYTNLLADCDDKNDSSQIHGARNQSHTPVEQDQEKHPPSGLNLFRLEVVNELDHLTRSDCTLLERAIARSEQETRAAPSLPMTDIELRAQSYI